jgi:hypothetical protein
MAITIVRKPPKVTKPKKAKRGSPTRAKGVKKVKVHTIVT